MTIASIHLAGSLAWWQGLFLAALFAWGTWWLYRRETLKGNRGERLAWLLPTLRVIAVVLLIFMLMGPIMRHRQRVGEFGRVLVFLDTSESMSLEDRHMDVARKLLIARQRGLLSGKDLDITLAQLADDLQAAAQSVLTAGSRRLVNVAADAKGESASSFATDFQTKLSEVHAQLGKLDASHLVVGTNQSASGHITREYWNNVRGSSVRDLEISTRFNQPPSGRSMPDSFEAPSNIGDDYGQRFRGYVLPPVDGAYTFWIASDDQSILYLSSDENPENKRRIAYVDTSIDPRTWPTGPNESVAIELQGGRRYYIEAIHKEDSARDHLAVGWRLPIGSVERPIPGSRLAPYQAQSGDSALDQRAVMIRAFEDEVLAPVRNAIARHGKNGTSNSDALRAELAVYASVVDRWSTQFRELFSAHVRLLVKQNNTKLTEAIAKVEQQTRWARMQAALLETDGFLATLAKQHHVELLALKEGDAELLWWADEDGTLPDHLAVDPEGLSTDLSTGLKFRVQDNSGTGEGEPVDSKEQRVVAVVFSDGQHNMDGNSPQMTAAMLGDRRIPVYTVGSGALIRPEDLAIQGVDAPQTVFRDDRIKGEVRLTDDMPPGSPFTVTIEHEGTTVFSKRLVTDRSHARRVPFDFSVKELVDAMRPVRDGVRTINVPLNLQVQLTKLDGEAEAANNQHAMTVHAITEPRRALLVDGRPRWETRYLRNLFDRDKRWSVNSLTAGTKVGGSWERGDAEGTFPKDRETLFGYDLVVLGDVDQSLLKNEELEWLHDYVNSRGGGLLLIDGRRGHLRKYTDSPIADLIPVDWLVGGDNKTEMPVSLKLSAAGGAVTSLQLVSDGAANATLWTELNPPHWVAPVRALEGAETLASAQLQNDKAVPVLVYRGYGAGKVIYLGMDETWRWRYEVADQYHARFWNQLAKWAGEPPFAVQSDFVKLDAGKPVYQPGEKAEIRARLRDKDGKPLLDADVIAELFQDGKKVASIPLVPDANKGGVFRGLTPELTAGAFEVGVVVAELDDEDVKAMAQFKVEDNQSLEKRELVMNEGLLQKMAQQSGGQYFREENLNQLLKTLEPLSHGKIVESETELWRSYWWFVPIMLLLTCEWALRKRAGML